MGISDLYVWGRRYRAYRRLYPLWSALYRAAPEIALFPPRSLIADLFTFRGLEFLLYRRVIEIRDAFLALRPYIDPEVVAHARQVCQAADLSPEETQAVVEAASLTAAVKAKQSGRLVNAPESSFALSSATAIRSEVATLERVARYYDRSPYVRATLARMTGQSSL
jgi:hypothetical protein